MAAACLRRSLAFAFAIGVILIVFAHSAHAEIGWEDNYRAKRWPTSYSACFDGEVQTRIGDLRRANPTLTYRYRSVTVNEYLEDEEAQCTFVIDRRVGGVWATVQVGQYINIALGSRDPCPQGATDRSGACLPKSAGLPCPPCNGSDPINSGTGNGYQSEDDYEGAAQFPLLVQRYYNSLSRESGPYGSNWRHYYQRRVVTLALTSGEPSTVRIERHDGRRYEFNLISGSWVPTSDVNFRLAATTSPVGWRVTTHLDEVEQYDAEGTLLSVTRRSGEKQTLTYEYPSGGTGGRLLRVTDQDGRALQFAYDASNRISSITLPDTTQVLNYAYDTQNRLTAVTYADATTRGYLYNETGFVATSQPSALTGITDENGARYASFYYDSQTRAIRSEHAGSADRVSIAYGSGGVQTITDAFGTARTFGYTTVGGTLVLPIGISQVCTHCGGSPASALTYDTNGNVLRRRDYRTVDTTYVFDTARNLETSRTEASGSTVQRTILTAWHPTFRLPAQIDEPGRRTTFTYDASGNVLSKTVVDLTQTPNPQRTWSYTYDGAGRVLTEDGPRTDVSDITTYTYYACTTGSECGQLRTITNALGQTTTYNTYNAHGQPLTITDANGVVTTLTYDRRQRLISQSVGSETTSLTYWPTGLLKRVTLPDGSFVNYTYDAAHRLTKIEDGEGNRLEYVLDALGNRTAQKAYDASGALALTRTQVFNTLNQLWKELGAAGTPAVTTTYSYDGNGNLLTANAPLSRNTSRMYDELERLKQVTDPGSGVTQYGYDAIDNLTSIIDPRGLTTLYTYNVFGDVIQQVSPDSGTTGSTYDSAGNLKTRTDARGKTGTYTYDALNRVSTISYPDQQLNFGYDNGANGVSRLTSASDANHALSWAYDAKGRVTQKSQTIDGITLSSSYGYTNGNVSTVVLPSGRTIAYGYSNGKISSIAVNGSPLLQNVLYEPFGPVSAWNWSNGTLAARIFDQDGQPQTIDSAGAYTYEHDNALRITAINDQSDATRSWTYGYDLLDRLTSAASGSRSVGYSYDANGNRLSQRGTQPASYVISASSNRLNSISGSLVRTYTYDAAGNTTAYSALTNAYSDAGKLKSVTSNGLTTSYVENVLGQRIKKSTGSSTRYFAYDEKGHLVGEYGASGALIQETIWLYDIPVATIRPSGAGIEVFYIHADHLNAPRRISRPGNNAIVWRWDSEPFGSTAPNEDPDGDGAAFEYNLRFPGQYYDAESGLSDNLFRHYDPATGRYTQSDPIGLDGGINPYIYVAGNPVALIDPSGLTQKDIDAALKLAKSSQGDLRFPADVGVRDLSGVPPKGTVVGLTIPGVGTIVDDRYLKDLTDPQACDLLNTIIHEGVHYTLPADDPRQDDNGSPGHPKGYPYDEADKRTTANLCKKLNEQRRKKCE